MDKRAIITGSLGQDGKFLTKELLENSYEVIGVVRKLPDNYSDNILTIKGDLSDIEFTDRIVKEFDPSHIFNLAGESNVLDPYSDLNQTFIQNCKIPQNILMSIVRSGSSARFFQASSSLMYGTSKVGKINEGSMFSPLYPYGVTKLYSHNIVNEFRRHYKTFACSGIFFNHESEERGENFFTQKIVNGVCEIIEGKREVIKVGDISSLRDISYAGDFMNAVRLIMEHDEPDDYVIGSGRLVRMSDFVELCFDYVNLDYREYLEVDTDFIRKSESINIVSDPSKIKNVLGWEAKKSLRDIVKIMMESRIKKYEK